jgi:hypothetical protein
MNGFLPAAVPMNIMESFRNVEISLNRVGLQIRCAVTEKEGFRRVCDELRGSVVK